MLALLLLSQIGGTERYPAACVVSDHQLASEVGAKVMQEGGNAVDAAVATGFALAVTYPAAGNIGGGGFMLVRLKDGQNFALDYREIAPKSAKRDMYLDASGNPTKDSYFGPRAAGVPGTVAGLYAAHQKFGKLSWKRVIQPAIDLAEKGFRLNDSLSSEFKSLAEEGKQFIGTWKTFGRNGKFYRNGEQFKQLELGATLRRIRDLGPKGFYEGKTADLIVAEMNRYGGEITHEDLKSYQAAWRKPLIGKYKQDEVITMPPPSSGGVIVLMMLGMVENDPLKAMGHNSAATIHLLAESMKRCFADRAEYMGDPDFGDIPIAKLLDPEYLKTRRLSISSAKSTPSEQIRAGLEKTAESEQTTHYSVVDAEGNAVSNTYTLNSGYGNKEVVDGAGFLLNNEMDDFTAKPGVPNRYNILQGEANAIQPRKRPLSSMTPTIVVRDGKLRMVVGSPGGPTIINTVFQAILNVNEFGFTAQRAVMAPRFHHQWFPDEIRIEAAAFSTDTLTKLKEMGHRFDFSKPSQGSCHAIVISKNGLREVGCDRRVVTAGFDGY